MIKKNILTQGNKIKADRLALENRLEDAQILYAKICKVDPTDAEVWVKLAETQRRLGQYSDAESSGRHAVRLLPNKAQPHHVLAASLHCQGKLDEAITGYRKAIQLQPSYPPSHYLLGNALMELGRLHEAESSLLYALKLRPNFSAALNDLGAVLLQIGRVDQAAVILKQALALNPQSSEVLANLGCLLEIDERVEEALEFYRRALRAQPDSLNVLAKQAELLEKIGRLEEANELLERGLASNSKHPALNLIAARLERRMGNHTGAVIRLEDVVSQPMTYAMSGEIHLLLGWLYDRIGQTDKVMSHLNEGKLKTASTADPDGAGRVRFLEKIAQTRSWINDQRLININTNELSLIDSPIFLIGFPRSGTTLLEQILDSHPDLQTMEEKPAAAAMEQAFLAMTSGVPNAVADLTQQQVDMLRNTYYHEMQRHVERRLDTLLVDKLPLNIVRVPLLWRVFPEARFILVVRHPCDVVLSCLMQSFGNNDAMANFVSLESASELYSKVMEAWLDYERCLPLHYHVIHYEHLITNFEVEAKTLLNFLGVGWHEVVLNHTHHAQQRTIIQTPSYHQVTQPIYEHAKYRWMRYEKDFATVIDTLQPFIKHFGYSS